MTMSIPQFLRGLLRDKTYRSTYDMAKAFDTPQPNVSRWLGGTVPSVPSCRKIAQATGREELEVIQMAYGGDGKGEA